MKTFPSFGLPVFGLALVLLGTVGMGLVQGRLTNRWGLRPDAEQAAQRLRPTLPAEVGNWRLKSEDKLAPAALTILSCSAYVARVYEHQQTGDVVNVAVLLGPPGPISVHTPEVCYSSREYTADGERRRTTVVDQKGHKHSLWQLPLKANKLEASSLRVFYGWSTGTQWDAVEYPRFKFGGLPHLYKLQVAVTDHPGSKAIEFDAGQDFLECFLPQLEPRMVPAAYRQTSSGE
jgi:hypothetical protein